MLCLLCPSVDDVVQGNAAGIDRVVDRIREMKARR
jgi:hypothetical protein